MSRRSEVHDEDPAKQFDGFIAKLGEVERVDLYQRVTSVIHERKHFHDLLLTPFGNLLVRKSFTYTLAACQALADAMAHQGDVIGVPLKPESVKDQGFLEEAFRIKHEYDELMNSARLTLEASATLAQLHSAWSLDSEAYAAIVADFEADDHYSRLLKVLYAAATKLGYQPDTEETFEHPSGYVHQVLFLALCFLDTPEGFQSIDNSVQRTNKAIVNTNLPPDLVMQRVARHMLQESWPMAARNLRETDEMNEAYLAALECQYGDEGLAGDTPLGKLFRLYALPAFRDFCSKSKALRAQFFSDPEAYFRLKTYGGPDDNLIQPVAYGYSDNDKFLYEKPLNVGPDELFGQYTYRHNRTGRMYYGYRLMPISLPFGGSTETMNRPVWVRFTRNVGAATLALEDMDMVHPLKLAWLKGLEEAFGVQFVPSDW
jgi:hypothetical protein